MRRYILGWFAISLLLMLAVFAAGFWFSGPVAFEAIAKHLASGLIEQAAAGAVSAFEAGGPDGLNEYERRAYPHGRVEAWLLRARDGRDVRGKPAPPAAAPVARARQSSQTEFTLDLNSIFSAAVAQDAAGEEFILVLSLANDDFWNRLPFFNAGPYRLAAAALAGALACSWLAGQLSAPLRRLQEVTRRFAAGDLAIRAGRLSSVPPIHELASDFDQMAGRIESLIVGQEQLLQYISHELRTPLTRLGLSVDLARRAATPETLPLLENIDAESARLNALIGRILGYSRLQAAQDPPRVEPVALGDFVEGIVADAEFEAAAMGLFVALSSEGPERFSGDRELLRSVLENVIRNALRFSPPAGVVRVSRRGGEIRVRDHGPGVPAEKLAAIFQPFERLPRSGEGFGLGLAIARRAIELHRGSVEARNAAGGGLEVILRLPVVVDPLA